MRYMTRVFPAVAVAALAAGGLTACGEKGANGQPALDVPNGTPPRSQATVAGTAQASARTTGSAISAKTAPQPSAATTSAGTTPGQTSAPTAASSSAPMASNPVTTQPGTMAPTPRITVPTKLPTTLTSIPGVTTQTGALGAPNQFRFVGSRGKVTILGLDWVTKPHTTAAKSPTSGHYLVLRVRIEGVSGSTLSSPMYFTAIDADGNRHTPNPLNAGFEPSLYSEALAPGKRKTGYVAIDTKKGPTTLNFGAGSLVTLVRWKVG